MAALLTEIVLEILSRLPVKSLLRFKSVCKLWNSLIKSSYFIKFHLNQTLISDSDLHLLVSVEHLYLHSSEVDIHHKHLYFSDLHYPVQYSQQLFFAGSCNGVVCISDISNNDAFLFNPLTRSHRKLPVNQIPNPANRVVSFGFGYDSYNDDYKVLGFIRKFENNENSKNEAQVYSLNNNSWKSIQGIPCHLKYRHCRGVFVNDVLHYMVYTYQLSSPGEFISCFDLRTESFSLMDYPKYDDNGWSNLSTSLMELGGCLCVMVNYWSGSELGSRLYRADLWAMKEYGNKESWFRLHSIHRPENFRNHHFIIPVVYFKDGRKILFAMDNLIFFWYDMASNTFNRCKPYGLQTEEGDSVYFRGSLVSLEDKVHCQRRTLPRKNKIENDLDHYLSMGFKLRL